VLYLGFSFDANFVVLVLCAWQFNLWLCDWNLHLSFTVSFMESISNWVQWHQNSHVF